MKGTPDLTGATSRQIHFVMSVCFSAEPCLCNELKTGDFTAELTEPPFHLSTINQVKLFRQLRLGSRWDQGVILGPSAR